MTHTHGFNSSKTLADLEELYKLALAGDQLSLALKTKEVLLKYFMTDKKKSLLDLKALTDEELEWFLERT